MTATSETVLLMLARQPHVRVAGGREIALNERDAALLALLAVEGPQSRVRVLSLLWSDDDEEASRNRLRQRLFNLRKACGRPIIEGQATLALANNVTHDLAGAGTLLGTQGFSSVAPLFIDWLHAERQRRFARQREALAQQVEALEGAGDLGAAVPVAEALLQHDPLSEDAHRRLMRLHYLRGDHAAALLAFDRCAELLKDEVGAQPSPETMQLLESMQRAEAPAAAPPRRHVPASVLRPPRLVGREAEWAWLATCWEGARIAVIAADGGMGKSRLLADFAAAHRSSGHAVLSVGARPGDARLPCALLSRLLRAAINELRLDLPEGVRRELARVLPELGDAPPNDAANATRFANAVEAALALAGTRGLQAVLVDDFHLADEGSVEILGHLCAGGPLRWVIALRSAELRADASALITQLQGAANAEMRHLLPLSAAQVAELLDSLAIGSVSSATWAEALHRRTGGNPQYVLECVKALLTDARLGGAPVMGLPPATGRLIQQRLSQLSPPAVKLARCAAVAGADFCAALATSVLRIAPLDLADAWSELEAAQVLRDGGFAHDLIYEAALASVPAAIAGELHREMAVWLEAAGGEPARIAAHWIDSGVPLRAAPHLLRAAETAMERLRFGEAAAIFERGGEIFETAQHRSSACDAYFSAAEALSRLGCGKRVAALGIKLEALAETDAQRARAGVVRAATEGEAGRFDEAERIARAALVSAQRAGELEAESELEWTIGVLCWEGRRTASALHHIERALVLLLALKPQDYRADYAGSLIARMQALGSILCATGRFTEALQRLEEAWQTGTSYGRAGIVLTVAQEIAQLETLLGRLSQADEWIGRIPHLSPEGEVNAFDHTLGIATCAAVHALSGRWGAAIEAHDQVAQRLALKPPRTQGFLMVWRALFYMDLGRRDLALKAARAGMETSAGIETQALALEVTLAAIGETPALADALLERVGALDDVSLRAKLLLRLAPRCEAGQALPALAMTCTAVRDGGALGLWLSLEARSTAILAGAGRHDEAAVRAQAVWQLCQSGITPWHLFADFAADLASALAVRQPALAQTILARGGEWLQAATQSLPAMWRNSCLDRSPMKLRLNASLVRLRLA